MAFCFRFSFVAVARRILLLGLRPGRRWHAALAVGVAGGTRQRWDRQGRASCPLHPWPLPLPHPSFPGLVGAG